MSIERKNVCWVVLLTMIERIGKNSGVLIGGTPKYWHARSESNLEYAALAGRVQGGLLPDFSFEHLSRRAPFQEEQIIQQKRIRR